MLFAGGAPAAEEGAVEHPSVKRPTNVPPSADLSYTIKAKQHGLTINGTATVQWRAGDGKYSIATESRAAIFRQDSGTAQRRRDRRVRPGAGHVLRKALPQGAQHHQLQARRQNHHLQRRRRDYPIKGGEQDRGSAQWQLAAQARATPDKFKPGSEWQYFVAGRRDAEPWSFTVAKTETVQIGSGEVQAVHLIKAPPKPTIRASRSTCGWRRRWTGTRCACASTTPTATSSTRHWKRS
jgi:hypothetical protein